MIHPHTEVRFINESKGKGLVATTPIPLGTITWVRDALDREITPAELAGYEEKYQDILLTYSFRNQQGNYIFCWDNGRFLNHSFHPNCCLTAYGLELAIRDIAPGEELTNDYGYFNIIEPFEPFGAAAEEGKRNVVRPDDLNHYAQIWDQQLIQAFPHLTAVAQPLRPFVDDRLWEKLVLVAHGKIPITSVQTCYYADEKGN
ncbi:MAG: SET domain-containing protein [Desulfobulbus sp.]